MDGEIKSMPAPEVTRAERYDKMKKYWLDCDSNGGTQFALYDGNTCVLRFDFDDIDGLKELEEAGKIGEAYALIDSYIVNKLGFLPDYNVG